MLVLFVYFPSQPPFYSRDTAEMYDNILYKPLRLRTNISQSARSLLEGVSCTYDVLTYMLRNKIETKHFSLQLLQKDRAKRLGAQEGDFVSRELSIECKDRKRQLK